MPLYPDRAILHYLSTAPPMSCSKSDDCHADKGKCVAGMCFCDGFFVGNGVVCRGEVEMSMSMKSLVLLCIVTLDSKMLRVFQRFSQDVCFSRLRCRKFIPFPAFGKALVFNLSIAVRMHPHV